jgi:hypothetical protein
MYSDVFLCDRGYFLYHSFKYRAVYLKATDSLNCTVKGYPDHIDGLEERKRSVVNLFCHELV